MVLTEITLFFHGSTGFYGKKRTFEDISTGDQNRWGRYVVGVTRVDLVVLVEKKERVAFGATAVGLNMLTPILAYLLSVLLLCRIAFSQYSSDQCSWKGR